MPKQTALITLMPLVLLMACAQATPMPSPTAVPPTVVPTNTPMPTAIPTATAVPLPKFEPVAATEQIKKLARGVNFGNMLETPNYEGEWGVKIEDGDFARIKQAGFTHVRVPIRWSAHAAAQAPYALEAAFLARVTQVVRMSLDAGLGVVINMHHYDELFAATDEVHEQRFIGLWRNIAQHFKDYPADLVFELLNEPNGTLNASAWNGLLGQTLAVVRETNPTRNVVIGTAEFGGVRALKDLKLPPNDDHLIVTVHYYLPFQFTHQGADWVSGSNKWLGTVWEGSSPDRGSIEFDFNEVDAWAKANKRPIWLGEFGAIYKADMESRVRWTSFIVREAERRGWGWAYWEYAANYAVFDRSTNSFKVPLLKALIP